VESEQEEHVEKCVSCRAHMLMPHLTNNRLMRYSITNHLMPHSVTHNLTLHSTANRCLCVRLTPKLGSSLQRRP